MQGQTFLVLDDDATERELISLTIKEACPQARITQASSPSEAEDVCVEHDFDCIIVDYNMPQMDGLSFAQKMRPRFPHTPVVLVTSVGDEMLAAQALRSGVSDYIPKSRINPESIHRTIARAIHASTQARIIEDQRAELENFAYALAHDFKQPIRQIRTFTKLISNELCGHDNDEVVQHLGYLGNAARRLGNLVDVMSQYTLLSQAPDIGAVDVKKAVDEVRASLTAYINERHGQIVVHELPTVKGNETLMIQALQNLIVNGLKYNKSSAPRIEIDSFAQNGRCVIAVRDNGIGMEEQYLTEIFKPLMRLNTAAEYPGSGLGLTLARKAINAQNGKIWCESIPDQGSTFYIELQVPESVAGPALAMN